MTNQDKRERFSALRQETGLSQGQLAELMGLKERRRINKLEKGGGQDRAPTSYHLRHLEAISFIKNEGLLNKYLDQY